jgi:hypothetical protein
MFFLSELYIYQDVHMRVSDLSLRSNGSIQYFPEMVLLKLRVKLKQEQTS